MHIAKSVWIAVVFCAWPTSVFADTYKFWEPGSAIEVGIISVSKMKVQPGEALQFSCTASDMDLWTTYEGELASDGAKGGGNEVGSGREADKIKPMWKKTGGEWLTSELANSVRWKAPDENGTYTITFTADDAAERVAGGSRDDPSKSSEPVIIEVSGAEVEAVRLTDAGDPSRVSEELLQMAHINFIVERVIAEAIKSDPNIDWGKDQPVWTGLIDKKGGDRQDIATQNGGIVTARAGKSKASARVDLVKGAEETLDVSERDYRKFVEPVKTISAYLGVDRRKIVFDIKGQAKWKKVNQQNNNLCATSAELSMGGTVSLVTPKIPVPLPIPRIPPPVSNFVNYNVYVEAAVVGGITGIRVTKDATYNPPSITPYGGFSLGGTATIGIDVTAKDPFKIVTLVSSASLNLSVEVVFDSNASEIIFSYAIGRADFDFTIEVTVHPAKKVYTYDYSAQVLKGLSGEVNIKLEELVDGLG